MNYPAALGLTLGVEVPLMAGALVGLDLVPVRRALLVAAGANLLTHPVLWWALSHRPGWLAGAEAAACLVEAAVLRGASRRGGTGLLLVLAVTANAGSLAAGLLLAG